MKNILFLFFAICLLSSCKKDKQKTLFLFPLQDIEFSIPPTASAFQVHYVTKEVVTNHAGLFDANDIAEDGEFRIMPSEGSLNSIANNLDYDFIEVMSVRICDEGDFSETCGTEIFWRQPVPFDVGSVLQLVPSDVDIKQYLLQDKVNIQVKFERLRDNPPQFVDTRLLLDFAVR